MAKGIWGIDVGKSSIKVARLEMRGGTPALTHLEVSRFDIPAEDATVLDEQVSSALGELKTTCRFGSEPVVISLPGHSTFNRLIKLPPVDDDKIPEIVQYEAQSQIPFNIDEVIWDYQQMGWQSDEEALALEMEVGLFAIKRDQLLTAIKPFDDVDIDLDIVQLSPLAIYNFVVYDRLNNGDDIGDYDPENPPESVVILSMGTETTDLIITNGQRVWQRSIPLGGNHFTRQLTKELKLTFAKAEHLKRNARQAKDAKVIFQSMRPVFNDLVTEIQRSIG